MSGWRPVDVSIEAETDIANFKHRAGVVARCRPGWVPFGVRRQVTHGPAIDCATDHSHRPTLTRLEIVGPRTVPPGETAQFGVRGILSDGSTQDLTSQASWQSQSGTVLSVDSRGRASGGQRGATLPQRCCRLDVGVDRGAGAFSGRGPSDCRLSSMRIPLLPRRAGRGRFGRRRWSFRRHAGERPLRPVRRRR